eukprot:3211184-Rhodomonas_salina.1
MNAWLGTRVPGVPRAVFWAPRLAPNKPVVPWYPVPMGPIPGTRVPGYPPGAQLPTLTVGLAGYPGTGYQAQRAADLQRLQRLDVLPQRTGDHALGRGRREQQNADLEARRAPVLILCTRRCPRRDPAPRNADDAESLARFWCRGPVNGRSKRFGQLSERSSCSTAKTQFSSSHAKTPRCRYDVPATCPQIAQYPGTGCQLR